MKKVIVTTTINPPTEAIEKFQSMADWDLVVIGDKKTPADYRLRRGIYVPPEEQEKYDPALSEAIGWNCIQRRNFGLLWAKRPAGRRRGRGRRRQHSAARLGREPAGGPRGRGGLLRDRSARFRSRGGHEPSARSGTAAFRCNSCRSAITRARAGRRCGWTCRPTSGTAIRTSTPSAAWSTPRSAASIRRAFPWRPTRWGPSTRRTRFSAAQCLARLFPVPARRPHGRHLGRLLSPGQGLPRRVEQGLGLPAAKRPRPGPRHAGRSISATRTICGWSRIWPSTPSRCWPICPAARPGPSALYRRHFGVK